MGIDFLTQHSVVLDLKERQLRRAGGSVPLKVPARNIPCFLMVQKTCSIPGASPLLVKGQIVDCEGQPCCLSGVRLVEPNPDFVNRTAILVARLDGNEGD